MPENLSVFIPLAKVDAVQRMVFGTLAVEEPDQAGEILDYMTAKPAFQKWSTEQFEKSGGKSLGNIREMHSKSAVGRVVSLNMNDELKKFDVCVHVSDDAAWKKVEDGVYTGFSVGGGYAKRWKDAANPKLTRYTPVIGEASLVDSPCMKSATFELIKADGTTELKKFIVPEPPAAPEHPALQKMNTLLDLLENAPKIETPKYAEAEAMEKGMCEVARMATIIDDLAWLQESIKVEAAMEGDAAPVSLSPMMKTLGDALKVLIAHEMAELAAGDAEKFVGLPQVDIERLTKMNLPAKLAKVRVLVDSAAEEQAKENAELKKTVAELEGGLEKLTGRIQRIERLPQPPKGVTRMVEKGKELNANLEPEKPVFEMPRSTSGLSPKEARAMKLSQQTQGI